MNRARVLVLGSGAAGVGHARAMARAGAEVVALGGRTASAVEAAARALEIPTFGVDWRAMIHDLRPDVVSVATPGGVHREMCEVALTAGCHVFCDKPLATTAADARALYELAVRQGVKTAYAECYRYQPYCLMARELVLDGAIGPVEEVECVSHGAWPRLMPFGWPHRLADGGGRLNNHFTHTLSMVHSIVGGQITAVTGEARNDLRRAPIGEAVHSFRGYLSNALTPEEAAHGTWAEVDSDWSYTALVRFARGSETPVSAVFRHMGLAFDKNPDYFALYGPRGTIHIEGGYAQGPLFLKTHDTGWDEVPLSAAVLATLPDEAEDMQRNWEYLAQRFLADIAGGETEDYQTFYDGWIYQEVIDAVRAGASGWSPVTS